MTIQLDQVGFGKPISWKFSYQRDATHPTLEIDIQIGTGMRSAIHPVVYEPAIHWSAISMHGADLCVAMIAQLMLAGVPERKD